jgi:hypothetical protein
MITCECGNVPTQGVTIVIGRGDSRTGTETTYEHFLFCDDCQRSDSGYWSVQNDGHSVTWEFLERDYADLIPHGWELWDVEARDIEN